MKETRIVALLDLVMDKVETLDVAHKAEVKANDELLKKNTDMNKRGLELEAYCEKVNQNNAKLCKQSNDNHAEAESWKRVATSQSNASDYLFNLVLRYGKGTIDKQVLRSIVALIEDGYVDSDGNFTEKGLVEGVTKNIPNAYFPKKPEYVVKPKIEKE